MNLLLDTHVWIWGLAEPQRIPEDVRDRLGRKGTVLWVSPISIWETLILIEKGRVSVAGPSMDWVRAALSAGPWQSAPLTIEIALESRSLALPTEDPADRFLAATAVVERLTLVSADRAFRAVPNLDLLAFHPE